MLGRYKTCAGNRKRPDSHYPPTFWPLQNHWKVLNCWHVFIPLWQLYCLYLPVNSLSWRTLSSDSRPGNDSHSDLKHQFKLHQMEQYLIFDIDTGLMEYRPQKTWQYQFHPYTSLMSTSSSRWTPSHLVKLNDDIHKPHSDISAEHCQWPFNPSTIRSPSLSQPFNRELGTRVTLPMLQIAMK